MKKNNPFYGFTPFDWCLWIGSIVTILLSFFLGQNTQYLYLIASLCGVTGLILLAKGHIVGQIVCVAFSFFYAYIAFTFRYYGEMITYLGMTAPIAIVAVVTWAKNPYKGEGKGKEVEVNKLSWKEYLFTIFLGIAVTVAFYFILRALDTPNLILSTVSVLTSFLAVYLTARRSPLYAVCYALNDVVLIILWSLATAKQFEYLSIVICFCIFFINDIYGFIEWTKMKKRQQKGLE